MTWPAVIVPSGTTRVVAVVGHPVGHSLSPALHNAAFAASGLDWAFVALPVAADHGGRIVDSMKVLGLAGLAVTTPHKQVVAATVDVVDPAARALASVNTVIACDDGTTRGASTDGEGFVASLLDAGVDPAGRRIAVLGAGAAARSVIDALGRHGVGEIIIVNRSPAPAEQAAGLADVARVGKVSEVTAADIVVNATSVGMATGAMGSGEAQPSPVDPDLLRGTQVVADLVYHPLETTLLAGARRVGATVVDGLGMLVHQAALQQLLWTGQMPDVASMRGAAEAELARRRR